MARRTRRLDSKPLQQLLREPRRIEIQGRRTISSQTSPSIDGFNSKGRKSYASRSESSQRNGKDSLTGRCRQQPEKSLAAFVDPFTAWWVAPCILSKQSPSAQHQSKKSIWRPTNPPRLEPSNLRARRISLQFDRSTR